MRAFLEGDPDSYAHVPGVGDGKGCTRQGKGLVLTGADIATGTLIKQCFLSYTSEAVDR